MRAFAARLAKAVAADDRKTDLKVDAERMRLALKERPLESLRPTLDRTEDNFRKVLRRMAELGKRVHPRIVPDGRTGEQTESLLW